MTNDLTTRVAKLLWAKIPAPQRASDEIDEAARAVVALVLGEAVTICKRVRDKECTSEDEAIGALECALELSTMHRALGDKT